MNINRKILVFVILAAIVLLVIISIIILHFIKHKPPPPGPPKPPPPGPPKPPPPGPPKPPPPGPPGPPKPPPPPPPGPPKPPPPPPPGPPKPPPPGPIFPTSGDIYGFGDDVTCVGAPTNPEDGGPIINGPCPWLYMGSPILELAANTAIANAPIKNKPTSLIFGVGYIDSLADAAPMGACYRNEDRTVIIQKANPTNQTCQDNPEGNCNIDMLIAGNGEPDYGCCGIWLSNAFQNIPENTKNIDYATWSAYCASNLNIKNTDFCGKLGPNGTGVFTEWDELDYGNDAAANCKLAFPHDQNLQTACKNIVKTKEWGKPMNLIPCKAPKELIAVTKLYNKDWQNGNYPANNLYSTKYPEVKNIVKEWYEDAVDLSSLKDSRPKVKLSSDNKMLKAPNTEGHNGCRPENASFDQPGNVGALDNTTRMIACVKSPDADSMSGSITNIKLPDTAMDVIKKEVAEKGIQVVCDKNDGINITKDWVNKKSNFPKYNINNGTMGDLANKMGCIVYQN